MKYLLLFLVQFLTYTVFCQTNSPDSCKALSKISFRVGAEYNQVKNSDARQLQASIAFRPHKKIQVGAELDIFFSNVWFDETLQDYVFIEGLGLGIYLDLTLLENKRFALTLPLMLGMGNIAYVRQTRTRLKNKPYYIDKAVSILFMPSIVLKMRVNEHFKIGVTGRCRIFSDAYLQKANHQLIPRTAGNGWSAGIILFFGE